MQVYRRAREYVYIIVNLIITETAAFVSSIDTITHCVYYVEKWEGCQNRLQTVGIYVKPTLKSRSAHGHATTIM